MEIIAHRGSSFVAPENTLAAIRLGWEEDADAVEGDFRLTRDGQIVALHDATLTRTAGLDRPIADFSLAELATFDVGSWKGDRWHAERIPTLAACLATTPPGKRFFVELKSDAAMVPELVRVVRAAQQPAERVAVISLAWDLVTAVKQALPEVKVYHVTEFRFDKEARRWTPTVDELLEKSRQAKIDGVDLMAGGPLDADMTGKLHQAGMDLCAWTVDDPELARHLLSLGVTGITTNRPGWMRQQLET